MTSPDPSDPHTIPAVADAYAEAQTAATIAAVISLDIDATADGGTILRRAEDAATLAHQRYQAALHQASAHRQQDARPATGTAEPWTISPEEARLEDAYHDAYADYGELYFGDAEPEAITEAWTAVEAARQDLARARSPRHEPPAPDAGPGIDEPSL